MNFLNSSTEFWDQLRADSGLFKSPKQYTQCFQNTEVLDRAIRDILRLYAVNADVRASRPLLQLFVDNKPADLEHYFNSDNSIQSGETIEAWGERTFKKKKFILLINCIERFSDSASSCVASLMAPFLEDKSPEEVSFRVSVFIGNGGFTPFGAHIDVPGLGVTHFHLGPGSKSMTLWDKGQFEALTHSQESNCYDFDKYLKHGQEYKLTKGDVLFFPADDYYHIGQYHEVSVAAAVGVIKESASSLYKKAMDLWNEDIKHDLSTELSQQREIPQTISERIPEYIRNASIIEIIEDYKYKKQSNFFMHNRPLLKNLQPFFLVNKKVHLNNPFSFLVNSKKNCLYSRGRKLDIVLDGEILTILTELLEEGSVSCHENMTESALNLIAWLFNTGSVVFYNNKNNS